MNEQKQARETYKQSARYFADYYSGLARLQKENPITLADEMSNIFTAIGIYGDLKVWSEVVDIVQAINNFLDTQGYWEELVAAYNVAIESAEKYFWSRGRSPEPKAWHDRIVLRSNLSTLCFRRGEYEQARRLAEEALKQSRRIKHRKLEALLLGMLGSIAMAQGSYERGQQLHAQSRSILMALGESQDITIRQEAVLAQSQGDIVRAWQLELERLTAARQSENKAEEADALCELGDLATHRYHYDQAANLYHESLSLFRHLELPRSIAHVLNRMASLASSIGKSDEAQKLLYEQLNLERTHGDPASVLDVLQDLASLASDKENQEDALKYYEEALQLAIRLGNLTAQVICLQGLGQINQYRHQFQAAEQLFQESLAVARASGHPKLIGVALSRLSLLAERTKNLKLARSYLTEILEIERYLKRETEIAKTMLDLGRVAYLDGAWKDAMHFLEQSIDIYRQLNDESGLADCFCSISDIKFDAHDYLSAWQFTSQAIILGRRHNNKYAVLAALRQVTAFLELPEYNTQASELLQSFSNEASSSTKMDGFNNNGPIISNDFMA